MLKIEYVSIDSVKPYDKNAKLHPDEQVEQIVASIKAFGFNDPLGVWHDEIVEGHGRYLAAKKLGMTEVPVIRLDDLTDEQRKAYMLAHNKLTMNSGFDLDLLNAELESITDFDMGDFGFDLGGDDEAASVVEDDVDSATKKAEAEPRAKLGDVWLLGDHRLMCGSSTEIENMKKLCPTEVDLLFTDPPYNVDYKGTAGKIQNDNMADGEFVRFLTDAFSCADSVLKKGSTFYIWHASRHVEDFKAACVSVGLGVREELVWNKNSLVLGRSDYQFKHEPCLYGWKEGASHKWYGGRNKVTVLDENFPVLVSDDADGGKVITVYNEHGNVTMKVPSLEIIDPPSTVIYFNKPLSNENHPTMKPVGLCAKLIQNSTVAGDKVLDCFAGSGSTLMACEQLGRVCYAMELEPKFCDVIITRWEEFTGKKATRA